MGGWIGVDLDGTLAKHCGSTFEIEEPIPSMVARVKQYLDNGVEVRIMTARVGSGKEIDRILERRKIEEWCKKHIGVVLPVTATKDYAMIALYDDRAIAVKTDTGEILGGVEPLAFFTQE